MLTASPSPATTPAPSPTRATYDAYLARSLQLDMQRGQPSSADFDLSSGLLDAVGPADVVTASGIDIRNYPGGTAGLPEARSLFGKYLDVPAEQVLVWNNASLEVQGHVLTSMLLRGPRGKRRWSGTAPKMIVSVPGYDRHFTLLQALGFELVTVAMQADGPDIDAIEALVASDDSVRGILFVPTYSNPGGESISPTKARQLSALAASARDFTIFADDAYRVHHLSPTGRDEAVNFVELVAAAGNPDGAFVFASTSKITFASGGLGFVASSQANIASLGSWLGALSIGPNKVEQLRHVRFLESYPGGLAGLMSEHAALLAPKFAAVEEVLSQQLGGTGRATWTRPRGGYFVSVDTTLPVADRVVTLADHAGVSLTPAGAAFPNGDDPHNSNIRLAPTRPDVDDVRLAMEVFATCVKLASEEYEAGRAIIQ